MKIAFLSEFLSPSWLPFSRWPRVGGARGGGRDYLLTSPAAVLPGDIHSKLPVMNQAQQSLLGSLSEVLTALRSIYPTQTDFFLPVPLHQKRKGVSISHTYATSRHALCKDQRAQYTIHHCNEPEHKRKKQRSL